MFRSTFLLFFIFVRCFSLVFLERSSEFDVRNHLSSLTRYADSVNLQNRDADVDKFQFEIPQGCTPIHLNLLARHGTRGPTGKRMRELEKFSKKLRSEFVRIQNAQTNKDSFKKKETEKEIDKDKDRDRDRDKGFGKKRLPSWIQSFQSPWIQNFKGGELLPEGEEELFELGLRFRTKFKEIFSEDYHSKLYSIHATQIPRASASAVAFGMGLFYQTGSLGTGKHRSFAVVTETKSRDRHLRFHDTCPAYVDRKGESEIYARSKKQSLLTRINADLQSNFGLGLTNAEVLSLWLLCKLEASLLRLTNRSCALFEEEDIVLLEWMDDLEAYHVKGYGASINYRMGVPLLNDVIESMEAAVLGLKSGLEEECSEWRESKRKLNSKEEDKNGVEGEEAEGEDEDEEEEEEEGEEGGEGEEGASKDDKKESMRKWCNDNATHQRARLRFAHAETIVPFICLLGLFQEKSTEFFSSHHDSHVEGKEGDASTHEEGYPAKDDPAKDDPDLETREEKEEVNKNVLEFLDRVRLELPLPPPPMPPSPRKWRVSYVAPFAANTALVLYHCSNPSSPSSPSSQSSPPSPSSQSSSSFPPNSDSPSFENSKLDKKNDSLISEFMVLALHNEQPVVLPACGSLFCPFETFKEKVAYPHLKHSFESTCDIANNNNNDSNSNNNNNIDNANDKNCENKNKNEKR